MVEAPPPEMEIISYPLFREPVETDVLLISEVRVYVNNEYYEL